MKRVSLIAASLVALGWTAARADVGTTTPGSTSVTVTPPANSDVDVNIVPNGGKSPPAAVPGTGAAMPGGGQVPPPANVDINVNPPTQPAPVAAPVQTEVVPPPAPVAPPASIMPPARAGRRAGLR